VLTVENHLLIERFITVMPKVELHLHLEGAVRPATLLELSQRHGIGLPAVDEPGIADYFRFRNFAHFIEIYMAICECLRTPEDFARIVEELGEDAAAQHLRYLEVHFNPEPHVRKRGLTFDAMMNGMNRGRVAVRERHGVEMRWIADGVRDAESGPISVMTTVDWISGLRPDDGVVALGLGGAEIGHPPGEFAAAFERAREAGLHTVAHAGETTGPEAIWSTLRELKVERIGHGVSAIDDPLLIEHLIASSVPLEICPTSNVRTRVVNRYEDHPFRRLDEAGVCVTVNTDDPALFGCTLTDEYRVLWRNFGYGIDDLKRISLNAVEASFLSPAAKRWLASTFRAEWKTIESTLNDNPAP